MPSKVYQQGKFTVIEFPEIWQEMVLKFYTEHPDLIQAAELAGVSINDGSFYIWLNMILSLNISRTMSMDDGCRLIMDALDKRWQTQKVEKAGREASIIIANNSRVKESEVDLLAGAGTIKKENLFYDPNNPEDLGASEEFQKDFAKSMSGKKS